MSILSNRIGSLNSFGKKIYQVRNIAQKFGFFSFWAIHSHRTRIEKKKEKQKLTTLRVAYGGGTPWSASESFAENRRDDVLQDDPMGKETTAAV